jgi:hypothetical protein
MHSRLYDRIVLQFMSNMFKKFVKQKELDAAKTSSASAWTTASPTSVNIQSINLTYASSNFGPNLQLVWAAALTLMRSVSTQADAIFQGCCVLLKTVVISLALSEQISRLIFTHDYLHRHHAAHQVCHM